MMFNKMIYTLRIYLNKKQKMFSMESKVRTHLIGANAPLDQTVNTFAGVLLINI